MKKILFLVLLISTFSLAKFNWHSTNEIENIEKVVKVGDVIIFRPNKKRIIQGWGHCMFVVEDNKIADFPKLFYGFREYPYSFVKDQDREFVILRYKGITDDIRQKMLEEIYKYQYYNYSPFSADIDTGVTYCSQFISQIFEKVVGNIAGDFTGPLVMPLDILNSPYLEIIEF